MNFKSQISTNVEQSEKLIAMGLKPETADMCITEPGKELESIHIFPCSMLPRLQEVCMVIPSWSLSRLFEMMPHSIEQSGRPNADLNINTDGKCWFITYEELGYDIKYQVIKQDLFNALVDMIKCLIGECYFKQDYLIHSNSSNTGKEDSK